MKPSIPCLAAALLATAALQGCATNPKFELQLQNETAVAVGNSLSPMDVKISDIATGTVCYTDCPTTWRAATPVGDFECSDPDPDQLGARKTICTKRK